MEAITNKEQIVVTNNTMDSEKHKKNKNDYFPLNAI